MAQEELKKMNDGDNNNKEDHDVVPFAASKRVLEIKSKKIDELLNSLHSSKNKVCPQSLSLLDT